MQRNRRVPNSPPIHTRGSGSGSVRRVSALAAPGLAERTESCREQRTLRRPSRPDGPRGRRERRRCCRMPMPTISHESARRHRLDEPAECVRAEVAAARGTCGGIRQEDDHGKARPTSGWSARRGLPSRTRRKRANGAALRTYIRTLSTSLGFICEAKLYAVPTSPASQWVPACSIDVHDASTPSPSSHSTRSRRGRDAGGGGGGGPTDWRHAFQSQRWSGCGG